MPFYAIFQMDTFHLAKLALTHTLTESQSLLLRRKVHLPSNKLKNFFHLVVQQSCAKIVSKVKSKFHALLDAKACPKFKASQRFFTQSILHFN